MSLTPMTLPLQAQHIVRSALLAAQGHVQSAGGEIASSEDQARSLAAAEKPTDITIALGALSQAVDTLTAAHDIVAAKEANKALSSMVNVPPGDAKANVKFSFNGTLATIELNTVEGKKLESPMRFTVSLSQEGNIGQVQVCPHNVLPIAGMPAMDFSQGHDSRSHLIDLTVDSTTITPLQAWLQKALKQDLSNSSQHAMKLFSTNDDISIYCHDGELAFHVMERADDEFSASMTHYLVTFRKKSDQWQYSRGLVCEDIAGSLTVSDFWHPGKCMEQLGRSLKISADEQGQLLTALQSKYSTHFDQLVK